MKSPEETKTILVEACEKVKEEGWEFIQVDFINKYSKKCCPLMAVALTHGYNPDGDNDNEDSWANILNEVFDASNEEWSAIWRGYDADFEGLPDGSWPNQTTDPYTKIGVELQKLFPPIVRI